MNDAQAGRAAQMLLTEVAAYGVDFTASADVLLAAVARNTASISIMAAALDGKLHALGLCEQDRRRAAQLAFELLVGIAAVELTPAGREAVANG